MTRFYILLCTLCLTLSTYAQEFRHPGLIVSQESLDRMQGYIEHKTEPAYAGFLALQKDNRSHSDYKMRGPYRIIARDGQYKGTKGPSEQDFTAAFYNALRYHLEGDKAHADKALSIINAYADSLQAMDGHDGPLCCLQVYLLVNAMELMRQVAPADMQGRWKQMLQRAVIPTIERFEADSPYANGNWGAIVNKCRMAIAIYTDDRALYDHAREMFLDCNDNGALPHYISTTGQCQETGRDQAHAQLGIGNLAEICEMAWNQGDDLWAAHDRRMLTGYEYTAKYNLGHDDIPFETWSDCTGLYCNWTVPSAMQRGKFRPVYELAYAHYVGRLGLQMPYTARVLGRAGGARPEVQTGNCDAISPASLLFYNGTSVDMKTKPLKVEAMEKQHHLYTYPAPAGAPLKQDYEVLVQPYGSKEWTRIDTYMARVNAYVGDGKHRVSEISYGVFDFDGGVHVRVITHNRKFQRARVRPHFRGVIANVQNDSTMQFQLFQPENVSVEFDEDITNNLLLFTSQPPISVEQARKEAKKQGRDFQYYAPGLYSQENIRVASNTTIYLAPGSYFTGTFSIEDVHDVSILGRGIARPGRGYEGCHVYRSQRVLVDGLTLCTCPIGGSQHVTLHDVRSISHPQWGDGLNVFGGSEDITYDRVFCRNSDDCTTAYATRKGFSGSVRGVRMTNSTLWPDVAHPIFIGIHGAGDLVDKGVPADSIVGLVYENIDILGQAEAQLDYQGCLAINCGDNNLVRDVRFDNIRIEAIAEGSICQIRVSHNEKYCTAPGRGVRDVLLRNVRYTGPTPSLSLIMGYDAQHTVSNIIFDSLRINGRAIHDKMPGKPGWYKTGDMAGIFVGSHASGVEFRK